MSSLSVSSVSGTTTATSTYESKIDQLNTQITKLQTKITKINAGDGDEDTKQKQIEIIQTQIQQLEAQIQRIQSQQSREAVKTQETTKAPDTIQESPAAKDPYSNNVIDILA